MPATRLTIPAPCPKSWAAMTPTAAGRHCAACAKTVVDFTWRTDAEILAILRQAAGETCGRLRADQLNRPLVAAVAAGSAQRWRAWLAATLALWGAREGSSLAAEARTEPAPNAHHSPTKLRKASYSKPTTKLLHGTARDAATHEPLAGVAVFLKGENRAATTDSAGRFSLRLPAGPPAGRRRRLVLHRAGYLSRQLPLAPAPGAVQVGLRADPAASGVEVVAMQQERECRISSGAVATISIANEQPPPQPAARPGHGFFYWLTRPFRRS
ncbi:carboxypeptidase-like regulatory domain-containing protein [Hymenobacter sp. H14-R3]|uniref:carboxypeptidase-like regulatory domain-containing protein n=1 Tax=Hymenobacter sp. H14-R3 TaxID=3046308 RepID=UPI0024BB1AFB|nr:carboxypeptidase-like regulatory domain-containing protein [Hymenobacter sp. H14-R3]MDJ0364247.1 carboxypeptidase-like regulatory domain-containing protein [Hymenobacter sp. H14-R3]